MHLSNIAIKNFRSIRDVTLDFSPRINIIVGANAQGKTNLLESIYCLLKGRSFRTRTDQECRPLPPLATGERGLTEIEGTLFENQVSHTIRYVLTGEIKRVYFDTKMVRHLADYWSQTPVVVFTPDDISIVKGPPALRRAFMDMLAGQLWQSYIQGFQEFNQTLKQRNALLRRIVENPSMARNLNVWDEQLANHAATLYVFRHTLIKNLNRYAPDFYKRLSGINEEISLEYDSFIEVEQATHEDARERYSDILLARREIDIERGITTTGPQRDDFYVQVDDLDSRYFSSQGQQRSVLISLRAAEAAFLEEQTGVPPILLLDDILSELDESHRTHVLTCFPGQCQIVLTTTEISFTPPNLPESTSMFEAKEGDFIKKA